MRVHLLSLLVALTSAGERASAEAPDVVDEATVVRTIEASDPRVDRIAADVDAANATVKDAVFMGSFRCGTGAIQRADGRLQRHRCIDRWNGA